MYSKDGFYFALLFTLLESLRTSDSALFRLRRTVGYYGFTLDAWTLKPSGFCNVGVNLIDSGTVSNLAREANMAFLLFVYRQVPQ